MNMRGLGILRVWVKVVLVMCVWGGGGKDTGAPKGASTTVRHVI